MSKNFDGIKNLELFLLGRILKIMGFVVKESDKILTLFSFITDILIDGVVVSTVLAGIRRGTGWKYVFSVIKISFASAFVYLEPRIKSYTGRTALKMYLNTGI